MAPFSLRKLPYGMRHVQRLQGAWKGPTAGGCLNYDTVIDNPRFALSIDSATDLQIELTSPADLHSVGLELSLLPTGAEPPPKKPTATSGNFRKGMALLEVRGVPAGRYALLASTFEPHKEGAFHVSIGSSQPLSAKPLAPEGHGLQRRLVRGEWSTAKGTANGCANFGNFHRNPSYRLILSSRSEVLLRLRLAAGAGGGRRGSLSIDLYQRGEALNSEEGRRVKPFLSSGGGVYSYPPGGALIPRAPLEPGTYLAILSTFDPLATPYELIVYATEGAMRIEQII